MSELQRAPQQIEIVDADLAAEAEHGYCLLSMAPHVEAHAGVATVGATLGSSELPDGWWLWTSGNDVEHAVEPNGKCSTCGRTHDRSIDAQTSWLYDVQRAAETTARTEHGQHWLDEHWIEIALAVLETAPPWITTGAHHEYLRCNGIDVRTLKPADPTDEMSADG